jgi:hypothetical protein|tara:strand:+ start:1174 stop:1290 length:117 start_codon:yes stop_codon:yes gene_type:complete
MLAQLLARHVALVLHLLQQRGQIRLLAMQRLERRHGVR